MLEQNGSAKVKISTALFTKNGLIGGTGPESTIEYYKGIVYGVQQKSGRSFFPNLAIESLSVFGVLDFCGKQPAKLVFYGISD